MNAAKRQQFRWAKGSIQVALKLLLDLIIERKLPVDTKVQAFLQLTRHVVHPLFLIQFIVFPILLALDFKLYTVSWAPVTGLLIYVLMGPATYLYIIRKIWGDKWKDKAKQYLFLIFFATGISVNNTVAVFDALLRHNSEFLRTPKFGILKKGDDWKDKEYVVCPTFYQNDSSRSILWTLRMYCNIYLHLFPESSLCSYYSNSNRWVYLHSIF